MGENQKHTRAFCTHIACAKFAKTNVYTKPDCAGCWAKFYCSGGCVANAQNFNGSVEKPYDLACHLQKKRVECAIAIKAAL